MRWSLSLLLAVPVACWSPGPSDKVPAHTGESETGSGDSCAPTCDDDTGSESGDDSTAETGVDTGPDSSGDSVDSSADDSGGDDTAGDGLDLNDADAKLLGDTADLSAGNPVSDAGDANGDGLGDLAVAAGGTSAPGIVYVMQHPVLGSESLASSEGRFTVDGSDEAGLSSLVTAIDGGADFDADGYADLLVGTYGSGLDGEGWAWVLQGPVVGDLYIPDTDAALYGAPGDIAGSGVAWIGDMNGDGWEDMAIGANGVDGPESTLGYCSLADEEVEGGEGGNAAGGIYLVLGPVSGTMSLEGSEARLVGEDGYDYAGEPVVPAGDLDGDGVVDLFGAAALNCEGGYEAGAAYVVLGPVSGEGLLADADAKLVGEFYHDRAGESLAVAGDTNGDGWPDLLVGAPEQDGLRGETYLVLGPASGTVDLSTADAMFTGEAAVDYSGASVVGAGDQDADGYADLAIGAYFADAETTYGGALYILFGPQSGAHDLGEADAKFTSPAGAAGKSIANVGDVDADGLPDLLVGAHGDDEGGDGAGAAYLLLGGGTLLTHARESR